jgi:type I restriction enzyme S subunit
MAEDGENLLSRKKPIAQIVSGKFWVNNHAHIFKANNLCDQLFLYYSLNYEDITHYITGSAQPKLSKENLNSILISLPPLPTQRKIAAVLGALDDKIENNRKICANLEAQAQAIFKSWFVDFEPFGGKMPQEWKMGKLGDVCTIKTGKLNSCAAEGNGVFPFFTCAEKPLRINKAAYDEECVLVAGNCTPYVNYYKGKFNAYQRTYIITPINNMLPCSILYFWMQREIRDMVNSQQGSVEKYFVLADFTERDIILPEWSRLSNIVETFYQIVNGVANLELESRALAEMRDALLPKLMSGEIDVEKVKVA